MPDKDNEVCLMLKKFIQRVPNKWEFRQYDLSTLTQIIKGLKRVKKQAENASTDIVNYVVSQINLNTVILKKSEMDMISAYKQELKQKLKLDSNNSLSTFQQNFLQ